MYMFTVENENQITANSVVKMIKNSATVFEKRQKMADYYDGIHAILTRPKAKVLSDEKIVTNHAKFIVDIATAYLLGNPVDYQPATDQDKVDLEPIIKEYTKQDIDELDHRIGLDCGKYGVAYSYTYNDGNDILTTTIPATQAFCIYDDTVMHKKLAGIYFKKDKKGDVIQLQIITKASITNYEMIKDDKENKMQQKGAPVAHRFGNIPIIEWHNNSDCTGDFEAVIPLIDAYNVMQSDRVNDKVQLVEALLMGYGFTLSEAQRNDMKKYRSLTGLPKPKDAKAEYLVKQLNETDVDVLRSVIAEDIHKISMVPNLTDKEFAGNSSGVALRYKLIAFEQLTQNKERYFRRGLMERLELYNNYLVHIKAMNDKVETYTVKAVFKRNLPQNDYETSQMIVNLDGHVSAVTLVSQLSFVTDAKKEVETAQKEAQEAAMANAEQFGVPPNADTNAPTEPPKEDSEY